MNIVAIGDIHGKSVWKQAFDEYREADKFIFLGDYVDGYTESNGTIYQNLQEIINIRRRLQDQVVLLIGNHDLQYMYYPAYPCSGFRPEAQAALTKLFTRNKDLFKAAYQEKKYLFTHAGVSNKWYKAVLPLLQKLGLKADNTNLAQVLNSVHESKFKEFLHTIGAPRGGFPDDTGGITWADIEETLPDPLAGMHQIVGHSRVKEIHSVMLKEYPPDTSITYIDCLDSITDFLYVEV